MPGRPMSSSTTSGGCSARERERRRCRRAATCTSCPQSREQHRRGSRRASTLSSTTSTRRPRPAGSATRGPSRGRRARRGAAAAAAARSNSLPLPGPSLRAVDRAAVQLDELPHQRQADAEPALASGRARVLGLHEQVEDAAAAARAAMPMPLSRTRSTAVLVAPFDRDTVMRPPGSVYLAALSSRFADHLRRAASRRPRASSGSRGSVRRRARGRARRSAGGMVSTALRDDAAERRPRSRRSSILPAA